VLVGALRRFAALLALAAAFAVLVGLFLAAVTHETLARGLAIGFYITGVGLCALAFQLGSRPPVRTKESGGFVGFGRWVGGGVRFATRTEHHEALNLPAILAVLGVCLIVVGAAVDSSHTLS
jgi:peptidoglycan/LPS O-acetylase OafA/YrhL